MSVENLDEIEGMFFCAVNFVYIQDTAGDVERIRTNTHSTDHSLQLRGEALDLEDMTYAGSSVACWNSDMLSMGPAGSILLSNGLAGI